MDVSKLIADLAAHGVASFKGYGIEIEFHRHREQSTLPPDAPAPMPQPLGNNQIVDLLKKAAEANPTGSDAGLAQSLDGELPYDQVLNWSGSPDASSPETPLTGDAAPISDQG